MAVVEAIVVLAEIIVRPVLVNGLITEAVGPSESA